MFPIHLSFHAFYTNLYFIFTTQGEFFLCLFVMYKVDTYMAWIGVFAFYIFEDPAKLLVKEVLFRLSPLRDSIFYPFLVSVLLVVSHTINIKESRETVKERGKHKDLAPLSVSLCPSFPSAEYLIFYFFKWGY